MTSSSASEHSSAGDPGELSDVPLDLSASSPFQQSVATALRRVPRGEVVTYGELAALAGHPRAPRAVGTVCARNPFMFLLPCHRVVSSTGIGGYGSRALASSVGFSRSKESSCDHVGGRARGARADRTCSRLRPSRGAVRRSSTQPAASICADAESGPCTSISLAGRSRDAHSRSSGTRGFAPRSGPTAGGRSTEPRASSCTWREERDRCACSQTQESSTHAMLHSSGRPGGSSLGRAAVAPTCGGLPRWRAR